MRSNAYCGNLLWQSSLTLQARGHADGHMRRPVWGGADAHGRAAARRRGCAARRHGSRETVRLQGS